MLIDTSEPTFKISSFCGKCNNCDCVGVALSDGKIHVTNTTTSNSPTATFTKEEWTAFIAGVKNGEFDI
jgi:predicted secreted Zn-dependent protease